MDKAKKLTLEEFKEIAFLRKFPERMLAKDYYVTLTLYLIKDIQGMYFKGGTALQKVFLEPARLSEDLDFTITRDIVPLTEEINTTLLRSSFFDRITKDKEVEGFLRIVLHYKDFEGQDDTLFIDLNKRAKLLTKSEHHQIKHFYEEFIPTFSVNTLSKEEMIVEKVAAAIGRNKPRDHYDIYQILKRKIPINMKLVELKCRQSGDEFNILKMFDQARKLKNRWDTDMGQLIIEDVTFAQVMKELAKHFKLKEEKGKLKKK